MDSGFGAIKLDVTLFLGIDRKSAGESKAANAESTTPKSAGLDSLWNLSILYFT